MSFDLDHCETLSSPDFTLVIHWLSYIELAVHKKKKNRNSKIIPGCLFIICMANICTCMLLTTMQIYTYGVHAFSKDEKHAKYNICQKVNEFGQKGS